MKIDSALKNLKPIKNFWDNYANNNLQIIIIKYTALAYKE